MKSIDVHEVERLKIERIRTHTENGKPLFFTREIVIETNKTKIIICLYSDNRNNLFTQPEE